MQRLGVRMQRLGAALLLFAVLAAAKDKPVKVSLDAKWNSSPLLLEASEFMADEGMFLEFIEMLKNQDTLQGLDNAQSWYYHTMKLAGQLLSPFRVKFLHFALSMRLYSPKVHLHQQSAAEKSKAAGCSAWAMVGNTAVCDPAKVKSTTRDLSDQAVYETLYEDDHRRCTQHCDMDRSKPVILYGELGSSDLNPFLRAETGGYTVLRHYVKDEGERKVRLSGYGVELAVKSTEYKAQDDSKQESDSDQEPIEGEISGFNFTRLAQRYPELRKELKGYKNLLSESSNELKPLKVWQIQDLSYQSAQKAISSDSSPVAQLEVLQDISQNFPSLASSLAKVSVTPELRSSIRSTQDTLGQYGIDAGDSALLINGITMDIETVDMFSLYDTIRDDLKIMEQLSQHGLANEDVGSLLRQLTNSKDQQFALDIRDSAITYINDLENDDIYKRWPKSLTALLQPTFPGMMRHLSRNLFNLVVIFDVNDSSISPSLQFLSTLYTHQAPLRIGLVPVAHADDEAGSLLAQVFFKLVEDQSGSEALTLLSGFYKQLKEKETYTVEDVERKFGKLVGDIEEVKEDEEYQQSREKAYEFYKRSGLTSTPSYLLNGVVLKDVTEETIEEVIVGEVLQATPTFQRAVYHGKLKDDMDPLEWLMMQDHVMPRLNPRVLNPNNKCVPINKQAGLTLDSLKYLYKGADDVMRDTTMLVVADLNSVEGRQLLSDAISHMKTTRKVRVGVVHNHDLSGDSSYSRVIQLALDTLTQEEARGFITKVLRETQDKIDNSDIERLATPGLDVAAFTADLATHSYPFESHRAYAAAKLGLRPGDRAVVSNGKLVGSLEKEEVFSSDDFSLLERYGASGDLVVKVNKIIKKMNLEPSRASDVLSLVLGTLNCATSDKSRKDVTLEDGGLSMITVGADKSDPAFDIVAIIEPLSRGAQKILPILLTLQKVINCEVKVYLNCKEKLSELPLKSYYRYVLEPELRFNVVGDYASGPEAHFDNLPHKSILTLNVLPPEGWLVESVSAVHDLDNIKLEQIRHGVDAVYELEYLLVEGHCYDAESGQPPRGLQLLLGTENDPNTASADTLVMANLGYFQLKATPGAWHLMVRPGRSDDIYTISSHEHTDSTGTDDVVVLMDSFKSNIISMKVRKREGMETMDLLSDENDEEEGGLWNSISSSLSGGSSGDDGEKDEYLNIFSLASGHLYERLMRIMILSIVKQTKSPVKFWLLKNYLSPEFKDFIPVMAEKYGFKYELVQYKWPRWLNQQTEKQRIMWGYKILFLDVLFPLGIKKIAFIDADQIVRTDIQELFNVDLEGAPYGYTPFCSDRTEMDGFRFWKTGYWANHLGRRPYHISALYVIDLKKFRKIAAGDRLRGQYQSLSQDPNSLSNLDQDLPNNMIHQVKMKSLPQEWLWCETWCSDESKKAAKTIDLCNNPLTKEPKLDAARRIVPEWTSYDSEIKSIWDDWQSQKPSPTAESDQTKSTHPDHTEL